jgi:hypothetical protein
MSLLSQLITDGRQITRQNKPLQIRALSRQDLIPLTFFSTGSSPAAFRRKIAARLTFGYRAPSFAFHPINIDLIGRSALSCFRHDPQTLRALCLGRGLFKRASAHEPFNQAQNRAAKAGRYEEGNQPTVVWGQPGSGQQNQSQKKARNHACQENWRPL